MRTIESIKENEVVHCKTEKIANVIMELFDKAGWSWKSGRPYTGSSNNWRVYGSSTCYDPNSEGYCSLRYFKKKGYTITDAKEFIAPTGEAGESEDKIWGELFQVIGESFFDSSVHLTDKLKSKFTLQRK